MIVTGIGSRETPPEILAVMEALGDKFMREGVTLRSGGAPGADQAFELGAAFAPVDISTIEKLLEIYLPWKSFEEGKRSSIPAKLDTPADWAFEVAAEYHPSYNFLTHGVKKLMARNSHQVMGPTLPVGDNLSDAVICWTPKGKGGGGTGQAIRIAKAAHIGVWDLAKPEDLAEVCRDWGIPHPSDLL